MRKKILSAFFLFQVFFIQNALAAPPVPDIKANLSDSSIYITQADSLSVSISLEAGDSSGSGADWWLAAYTNQMWFYFGQNGGNWTWAPGLSVTYQGPLMSLPQIGILNISGLPQGNYTFYFGVDTNVNAAPDIDLLYYDSIGVTVLPQAVRLQPTDFQYLGAFRLPGDDVRPRTFEYGGNAMTFNPNGDPGGNNDGFPGSLFITGHDSLPYGELPDGSRVAEVSIPAPLISNDISALNQAGFLQDFQQVDGGLFSGYAELPRIGMTYLSHPATGPKIHLAWGQHFHEEPLTQIPTHAWFDPSLAAPDTQGSWYIGNQSLYSVNGYLFEIPSSWADTYASGRYLATGRYRDGGWSGQGPSLFAYLPWTDASGTPAPKGDHLQERVLLLYENSRNTENVVERSLNGYQHCDEWEGGGWITTTTGKTAVLFAGTKGTGQKYWYGWVNPAGAEYPCVDTDLLGQFTLCRLANGSPCPASDLAGCSAHPDYRGWWATRFAARFIMYDPSDLAGVSSGNMQPWEPQPYAVLDIDEHLFFNPSGVEEDMLGRGVQRRYRLGDAAYDRTNDLLYVLELFADDARPVVHVWRVR
ncbi:MAG: hypothetical protein HZA17_14160 [Nitrospirae bacterium]|nr:hypothetical protein [Nitrospirota bacterium]